MSNEFVSSLNDLPSVKQYLERIGAQPRSLRTAAVHEGEGKYWRDVAVIRFDKNEGTVEAPDSYEPSDEEADRIKREILAAKWPELLPLHGLRGCDLPKELHRTRQQWQFRDLEGRVVMIQARYDKDDGTKVYVPWTYWTDKKWRKAEPDGLLPLYGLEQLNEHSIVFIHEGVKAAAYCRWLAESKLREAQKAAKEHPWGQDLMHAAHVGWIGGAQNPHRTDWSPLRDAGISKIYIVADNDDEGRAAVPKIARHVRVPTFSVEFSSEWPAGFDLADEFPAAMFSVLDEARVYTGPAFQSCINPATWATDLIPNPAAKNKPNPVLRRSFKHMWAYVEAMDRYVCWPMPWIQRKEHTLNILLRPFSDAENTARLINKEYRGRTVDLCYRPDVPRPTVAGPRGIQVNLHEPPTVRPVQGEADDRPWVSFLEYLFPDEEERKHVEKWLATLIAKPGIRIAYALLLYSEAQGTGKSTLAWAVLAPLVGLPNASIVKASDLKSQFNSWAACKRLIVCHEVYEGKSYKVYNTLKTVISDKTISIHEKFETPYEIENWSHVIACSNSSLALKIDTGDRRWFVPKVTEYPDREKCVQFHDWLKRGGHKVIRSWAENYGEYCEPFERAPMTMRKEQMIQDSSSEAEQMAREIAEALSGEREGCAALAMKEIRNAIRANARQLWETDYELRKVMEREGITTFGERLKIGKKKDYVLMNRELAVELERLPPKDRDARRKMVREHLCRLSDVWAAEEAF